ncbi:hypothetical protein CAEBREN_21128 [Caenorhabditis brenneri]|uniref:BTB domain-containing protein n=1 Tax=Caenorhabditis brenneri TaxID=135651 RepID=G0MUX2_CAEBE|nr:hypothetical protein CAEBREN_21128 [Caenorhabditis brenneri]
MSAVNSTILINFQDPDPNLHDIVLVVEGIKFYCSKKTLAKHSPILYTKFFMDPRTKNKAEMTLTAPGSAAAFNAFLNTINGVKALDDKNVKEVLKLAVQWKAKVAIDEGIAYLRSCYSHSTREKFRIAKELGLEEYKKEVISEVKTSVELKTLLPAKLTDLDHPTIALLLEKSMELHSDYLSSILSEMSVTAGPAPKRHCLDLVSAWKVEHPIRFDDPDPNTHDVVIKVDGRKFYCVKMTLAKHSAHFYDLFFKDPNHTGKKEFTIKGSIDPDEFDALLMVLHGVNTLDDDVVSGVLRMSKKWGCGVGIQQCVEFLKKSSELPIQEKFDLAVQFELEDFKKELVSKIMSPDVLKTLLPSNLVSLDHMTMTLILERSMELHELCKQNHRARTPYSPMWSPTSPVTSSGSSTYSPRSPAYSPT